MRKISIEAICGAKVTVDEGQEEAKITSILDSKNKNLCDGCRFKLVDGVYVLQNPISERFRNCFEDKAPTV